MSRPKKPGLSYFPFDVDFFSDIKIKRLRAKYGTNGIAIYLFLLCEIYRRGYYIEYNDDTVTDIAYEFNLSENLTRQIMNYLFSRSLLMMIESKLAVPVKIITARSVQLRYQAAKKLCRNVTEVDSQFWVLKENETESCIKVQSFENKSGINHSKSGKNSDKSEKNHTKESKVNKSKVKESKVCMELPCRNGSFAVTEEFFTELTHTYPQMNVEESLKKLRSYLTANPHKQGLTNSIVGYISMWLSEDDNNGKYRKKAETYEGTYDISEYESYSVTDGEW